MLNSPELQICWGADRLAELRKGAQTLALSPRGGVGQISLTGFFLFCFLWGGKMSWKDLVVFRFCFGGQFGTFFSTWTGPIANRCWSPAGRESAASSPQVEATRREADGDVTFLRGAMCAWRKFAWQRRKTGAVDAWPKDVRFDS